MLLMLLAILIAIGLIWLGIKLLAGVIKLVVCLFIPIILVVGAVVLVTAIL